MFDQMQAQMPQQGQMQHPEQNQESDLILAHFSPDELEFMDTLQGGPSWMELGNGETVREYSALAELPEVPELRALFEDAAMGDQQEEMPMGMARGGTPKGIPHDMEEVASHGRHGDSEVALIPVNLAQFFNELIDPSFNNKDHMPEYFDLRSTMDSIGSGLKSVGNFAGNALATAAPYIGEGGGYLLGSMVGSGDLGSQIGSSVGRGIGRVAQGLWNQESLPQALGQGAYQGGATFLKPTLQKAAGMTQPQLEIDPFASPRDQAIPQLMNGLAPLASSALGAIGGPVGAGIGAGLTRGGMGMLNGESPGDALRNGLKAGAWETGMPVAGDAVGAGINALTSRNTPMSTPGLQKNMPQMAHGGQVLRGNANPYTGFPEYGFLGKIFKKILPILGGIGGFLVGGPMGAAIGGGLGGTASGLAQGHSLGKSLGQGALAGGLGWAGGHLYNGGISGLGSALGMGGGTATGTAQAAGAIPSIAASEVGKMGAAQAMAPAVAGAAGSVPSSGMLGGIGSLLSNPAVPLAAMAGMSYMGQKDEGKRLKDWEKETARRDKYEKAYGTLDRYKMPESVSRKERPFDVMEATYGQYPRQHQFYEDRKLFDKGGPVQGLGKGQQDNIKARLSPDEYVMDADSVAAFGDGSSRAGAMVLDKVRANLRKQKRHSPKGIPPKAKPFEEYMPVKSKKKFAGIGR